MGIGEVRGDTASLGTDQETFLDQERFIDFFQGSGIFADGSSQGADSHRTALEGKDERAEDLVVNGIQAALVNLELVQGETRYLQVDASVSQYLGEIPDALEKRIGDTRRAAAAEGNLIGGIVVNLQSQDPGRPQDNLLKNKKTIFVSELNLVRYERIRSSRYNRAQR